MYRGPFEIPAGDTESSGFLVDRPAPRDDLRLSSTVRGAGPCFRPRLFGHRKGLFAEKWTISRLCIPALQFSRGLREAPLRKALNLL